MLSVAVIMMAHTMEDRDARHTSDELECLVQQVCSLLEDWKFVEYWKSMLRWMRNAFRDAEKTDNVHAGSTEGYTLKVSKQECEALIPAKYHYLMDVQAWTECLSGTSYLQQLGESQAAKDDRDKKLDSLSA